VPVRRVKVQKFGSARGHPIAAHVLAIEYEHADSARDKPYRHDFTASGIEMVGLPDGSLLIRHPRFRLWDDLTVEDDE
jgi:hypothetical protein